MKSTFTDIKPSCFLNNLYWTNLKKNDPENFDRKWAEFWKKRKEKLK